MKLTIHILLGLGMTMMVMTSCQQAGGNSTGSEFMPDMAHSLAYEANVYNYYANNTWGTEDEYYEYAKPRKPVKGTIPRNTSHADGIRIYANSNVPYYYENTEEDRTRATNEIIDNPYPITDSGLEQGKLLYNINCAICHGEKGDGNGYLVRDDGGKYPVQPANFLLDDFVSASNGRYYHSIVYGKNLMGSYSDKLNYEERWNVIHYIRSLQAKDKKLEYTQLLNTLNNIERPAGEEVIEIIEDENIDSEVHEHEAHEEKHDDSKDSHEH